MDSLSGLLSHISRSIEVLNKEADCNQTNCYNLVVPLKILKSFIDNVEESNITATESFIQHFEALDAVLSNAKDLVMRYGPKCSRIYMAISGPRFVAKFEEISMEISRVLSALPLASMSISDQSWKLVKRCIEELQRVRFTVESYDETIAEDIENALRDLRDDSSVSPSKLEAIADKFDLSSNQEILREACALEKEKGFILKEASKQEEECVNQVISLVAQMHEYMLELKQTRSQNGPPIPADFRCPLSLELMSDPVIIDSGQTYERAYIQQWLDQGMTTCPKTRRTLNNNFLIPNYTVKSLIENWCRTNNVPLPQPEKISFHTPQQRNPSQFDSTEQGSGGDLYLKLNADPMLAPDVVLSQQSLCGDENEAKKESDTVFSKTILKESFMSQKAGEQAVATTSDKITADSNPEQSQRHERTTSLSIVSVSSDAWQAETQENAVVIGTSTGIGNCFPSCSSSSTELSSSHAPINIRSSSTVEIEEIESPHGDKKYSPSCPSYKMKSVSGGMSTSVSDIEDNKLHFQLYVRNLIENLQTDSIEVQREAVTELRLLAKDDMESRITITECGAIRPLVKMLHSSDLSIQENSVTALLNLSLYANNHKEIPAARAIDSLVHVLKTGSPQARENAAAIFYSISAVETNKKKIGKSGAIPPLVDLLVNGSARGKKDAATAILKLSTYHDNNARIIEAGAVKPLIELMDPAAGMVDKVVAALANLSSIREGRVAIAKYGGISHLVEVVELGSQRAKENAAAALWQLCSNSNRFSTIVVQEGAIPPLVALSQSGTARAREKAHLLISHFKEHRG